MTNQILLERSSSSQVRSQTKYMRACMYVQRERWRQKENRKGEHTTPLPIARAHRYPATSHYLAVRSAPKAIEAIAELEDETGKLAISYS